MERVFGAGTDEVKSVSVMEGDFVSLNTDITEIQKEDQILWMFGPQETRLAEIYIQPIKYFNSERFRDRLQMDSQTGSLTIRNIRSDLTGLYKLQILNNRGTSYKRFNVTVYARLPTPVITRHFSPVHNPSLSSSSRPSESRCSLVCSVLNVSDVTLSWYKGMSVLSGISACNISISLSLPLEIQCLDDSYRCVASYSFTNRTTHLNTDLCHTCSDVIQPSLLIPLTSVGLLMVYAAVVLVKYFHCRNCKQASQQDLTTTESEYTQITYYLQTGDLPQKPLLDVGRKGTAVNYQLIQ
ncbi:uncharacterized protein LOC120492913 isoform X2 [Pimephales promelas]|uniref:uncharacterized protein LOC120492913 isoform X2 n=1 Tax=Pimephales promelas TaxID=90988 RepID=UPI001955C2A4|nr:uncharacterized protein LOC120492913 isoform X2 [Pimephales promelas]